MPASIAFSHPQPFQGATARVSGLIPGRMRECVVSFGDGSEVQSLYSLSESVLVVNVPGFKSESGADVVEKDWELHPFGSSTDWIVHGRVF